MVISAAVKLKQDQNDYYIIFFQCINVLSLDYQHLQFWENQIPFQSIQVTLTLLLPCAAVNGSLKTHRLDGKPL